MENNEIKHYGVLGMKWGVRRNPSKAYMKSVYKKDKIERKRNKFDVKATKYEMKAFKKLSRSKTAKGNKLQAKAYKYKLKSAKLTEKGSNWERAMRKEFSNFDIKRVPNETVSVGTGFTRGLIEKYELTPLKEIN